MSVDSAPGIRRRRRRAPADPAALETRSASELGWAGPVSSPELLSPDSDTLSAPRPVLRRPSAHVVAPRSRPGLRVQRGPLVFARSRIVPGSRDGRVVALADGGAIAWGDDETTRRWTVPPTGTPRWCAGPALPGPAYGAPGVRLGDGSVLVVGAGASGDQLYRWVPGADEFEARPPLAFKRHGAAVVSDDQGGAWVVGGIVGDGRPAMVVERVTAEGATEVDTLAVPRPDPLVVVVRRMLVVLGPAGASEPPEIWSLTSGPATVGRPAPEPRVGAAAIGNDGQVLRVGGRSAVSSDAVLMPGTHLYDLDADVWRPAGYLATPRFRPVLAPWGAKDALLIGGEALDPKVVALVEHFDGTRWSRGCTLSVGRIDHAAVALADGRVLVAGGRTLGHLAPPFSELSSRP